MVSSRRSPADLQTKPASLFVPHKPTALGSYEELIAASNVDAVYVPLPTGLRKQWVIKAAEAGKHVMCEKPCAVSATDLAEMTAACEANQVQFMDGVMFMHNKRMQQMRACLDAGDVGELRRIAAHFSFCAPTEFLDGNIRVNSDLEPQGCLGDLGWYTIRFALWTMNFAMPVSVTGRMLASHGSDSSPQPVPAEFSGELFFKNGVSAGFYNSFRTDHQQWANISGTAGNLHVQDFVLPYFGNEQTFDVHHPEFAVRGCDFNMERHTTRHTTAEYSNSAPDSQETNLFRTFSGLVLGGKTDARWPQIALKTQQVLDACLESARNDARPVTL